MKANADKTAKSQWFRALSRLRLTFRCARSVSPARASALPLMGDPFTISWRSLLGSCLAPTLLLCSTVTNTAIEFECSGVLQFQTHVLAKQITQREAFHVYVRDDHWLIKIAQNETSFPSDTNAMALTYFTFNDENYVKTVSYANERKRIVAGLLEDPSVPEKWKEAPELLAITQAWIEKRAVPWADGRPGPPALFYAFCSRSYLDAVNDALLIPPFMVGGRPMPIEDGLNGVSAHLKRLDNPPYLPEEISFMHEGVRRLGFGVTEPLPEAWKGFTNAVFKVSGHTNLGGIELPLSFELKVYMPGRSSDKGQPPQLILASSLLGVVTNATDYCTLSIVEMKPAIQAPVNINDKRLSYRGVPLSMRYTGTNWLSEENLAKLPQVQSAKYERDGRVAAIQNSRDGGYRTKGRLLFFGTLLLISVISAYFWYGNYAKSEISIQHNS